jgi:CRISPR/Cas system-associated exonuclease Cas4 (RecB family)
MTSKVLRDLAKVLEMKDDDPKKKEELEKVVKDMEALKTKGSPIVDNINKYCQGK